GGAAVLTDGARQGGGGGWWQDDPGDTDPGWAKVEWGSAQELSKVVLRMPVADGGSYTLPDRTHGEAVLQFWDGDSWETIDADDNPIDEWIVPTTDDGSQIKTFEFDPISTTKIRFLEIEGNAYGHAGLEEIEAYPPPPPPPLTEDTNLALPANDGEVTASSTASGAGDPETLNDGTQQGGASGWWADDPIGPEPASAELAWPTEQAVDKLVLRMPVTGASSGDRTFGELVAEYWDGDSWEEIAASGNPIEDWEAPTTEDGSEVKTLEFDEISTTKIRVSFTEGNANSDAWLEEIEAYGPATCPPQADTNYALVGNGGEVTVSSLWTYSGAPGTLNNGVDQAGGIWQDHPSGEKPAWAQVTWGSEQTLNRIGLRVPIIWGGASVGELTFGEIVVQFWDGDSWEDIDAAGNPIEDWLMPTIDDGSQVKSLSFDPIATTKIRIRFNEANSSGDAAFEEIEAYGPTA
ncbi:MAG: hypothetical protein JHC95_22510, partial [Solirubrobacteraceae bacterium]|nr:hypothetical protein [Solirubrobacteraceae bacterium]